MHDMADWLREYLLDFLVGLIAMTVLLVALVAIGLGAQAIVELLQVQDVVTALGILLLVIASGVLLLVIVPMAGHDLRRGRY